MTSREHYIKDIRGKRPSARRTVLKYLAAIIPVAVLILVLLYWIYEQQVQAEYRAVVEREQAEIDVVERLIRRDFRSALNDLVQVAENDHAIKAVCDHELSAQLNIADHLEFMTDLRGIYDQVRLIDASGMEIVRIDYKNGRAIMRPAEELQNKRHRYFFREAMALPKGSVYISPFDLNIEHGEIERPFKPVIRLASPIINHHGQTMGVAVFNYRGDIILDQVRKASAERFGTYVLLNKNGYYLEGFRKDDAWGFQLPKRAGKTFQATYPNIWQSIQTQADGRIRNETGEFLFHTVSPMQEAASLLKEMGLDDTNAIHNRDIREWILVAYIPETRLMAHVHEATVNLRDSLIQFAAGLLLALVLVTLIMARFRQSQLQSMHHARKMALFPAFNPGPTVRLDEAGHISLANQVFRDLFGTDVTGIPWSDWRSRYIYNENSYSEITRPGVQEEWAVKDRIFLFSYHKDDVSDNTYIYGTDITERKKFAAQVAESESRLRAILSLAADAIITIDESGTITEFNHTAENYFGYSRDEAIGRDVAMLVPEPHKSKHQGYIDAYLMTGITRIIGHPREIYGERKDGSTFPVDLSITEVEIDGKRLFTGIIRDITERKKAEQELKLFRQLIDNSWDGIYVIDPADGKLLDFNQAAYKALGYTRSEFASMRVADIDPDVAEDFQWNAVINQLRENGSLVLQQFHKSRTGDRIPVEISSRYISVAGQHRILAIVRDITERKQAEEALRASEKWFATTLHSIGDAVVATDVRQKVTFMNQVAQELTGWSGQEASGHDINDVMHMLNVHSRSNVTSPIEVALKERHTVELMKNTLLVRRDGREIPIDDSAAPIIDEDGDLLGAVMVFRDITLQNENEEELIKARDAAEAGSRAKSAFLANMSHELRTPLNAVIGLSQVLQEDYFGPLTDKQREYVDNILSSGQHLLTLINDILDLSKIEAGGMELNLKHLDLAATVASSLSIIQQKTVRHGITLTYTSSPETDHIFINGDETKIRQIMYNLLSNAAKFTPDGGTITVHLEKDADTFYRVSVQDTGIGIPREYHKKIFDPFFQVKGEHQSKVTGTGLGMSLCKQMVELHGGRIWLHSDGAGSGTTFFFTLPVSQGPDALVLRDKPGRDAEKTEKPAVAVGREDISILVENAVEEITKYQNPATLFIVRLKSTVDADTSRRLVENIEKSKRDYDIILRDDAGVLYLVFMDITPEHADNVRNRIETQIRTYVKSSDDICLLTNMVVQRDVTPQKLLFDILKAQDGLGTKCFSDNSATQKEPKNEG